MRKPKANRSYSLDLETIMMLEKYASASESWSKRRSRSKIVNDAIRWFLTGDMAEKVHSAEELQENFRRVCIEKDLLEQKLRRRGSSSLISRLSLFRLRR
jgi:hypothetical protein